MLPSPVQLHDIKDVEAFVRGTIRRKVQVIAAEDMEDMVCEGIMILYDLSRLYDSSRDRPSKDPDHQCRGANCCKPSFAGYANFLLPKKLTASYYRGKPNCMLQTKDGVRGYVILETAITMYDNRDHILDQDNVRHPGDFIPVPEVTR